MIDDDCYYDAELIMAVKSFKSTDLIGLYYKQVMIVNEDSSINIKWSFKLIDNPWVVIYDHNRFITQTLGCSTFFIFINALKYDKLVCLSLESLFKLTWHLWLWLGAYHGGGAWKVLYLDRLWRYSQI